MNSIDLVKSIETTINAGLTPMVYGAPGLGKSSVVNQIAADGKLQVIDLRLSQCDPTDLNGFPKLDGDKAKYVPMDTFPIEGTPIPEGKKGWLLFLDEFNSSSRAVQAAAYKLILDRMVGQYKLHNKVYIVGAGNRETDGAITNTLSSALKSRLVNLTMDVDSSTWLAWANKSNIDYRVIGYINTFPNDLQVFNPEVVDTTYPCPRTWEMVSKLLKKITNINEDWVADLLQGTIGGSYLKFLAYCKTAAEIPSINSILQGTAEKPKDTSMGMAYLITAYLAANTMKITSNVEASNLMTFLDNLGSSEYTVVFLRSAFTVNPGLSAYKAISDRLNEVGAWLN